MNEVERDRAAHVRPPPNPHHWAQAEGYGAAGNDGRTDSMQSPLAHSSLDNNLPRTGGATNLNGYSMGQAIPQVNPDDPHSARILRQQSDILAQQEQIMSMLQRQPQSPHPGMPSPLPSPGPTDYVGSVSSVTAGTSNEKDYRTLSSPISPSLSPRTPSPSSASVDARSLPYRVADEKASPVSPSHSPTLPIGAAPPSSHPHSETTEQPTYAPPPYVPYKP